MVENIQKENLSVCKSPVGICQMPQSDVISVSIFGLEECSRELYVRRINTFHGDEVPMMLLVFMKMALWKIFVISRTGHCSLSVNCLFALRCFSSEHNVHQQLLSFAVYTCGGRSW